PNGEVDAQRLPRLGQRPREIDVDRADRGDPAQAEARSALQRAGGERRGGVAGVEEGGDSPLVEELPVLQIGVVDLDAAGEEGLAADHMTVRVLVAELLV